MKFLHLLSRRNWIIVTIIIAFLIYIMLQLLVFKSFPVVRFLSSSIDELLSFAEKISNRILALTGNGITIDNHIIMKGDEQLLVNDSGVFMKKFIVFMLILFWLTGTTISKKVLFTAISVLSGFIFAIITIIIAALLARAGSDNDSAWRISRTAGVLFMVFLCHLWIRNNKEFFTEILSRLKFNAGLIYSKMTVIFLVIYLYVFASNYIYGYLNFNLWIDLLFNATGRLLSLFGIEASVEPYLLIGNNGSLYMARPCLGFNTILLFASVVYLTGINNLRRWSYIIIGFLFLNFVNIIRFALIFVHVQKYGDYMLKTDIHDMYTYITYGIVFVMWIIWFEFITDLKIRN
jgi:exosortase/archaeosortase family protein